MGSSMELHLAVSVQRCCVCVFGCAAFEGLTEPRSDHGLLSHCVPYCAGPAGGPWFIISPATVQGLVRKMLLGASSTCSLVKYMSLCWVSVGQIGETAIFVGHNGRILTISESSSS